jgi:peptidyl-prolyl cis-trans isomerase D
MIRFLQSGNKAAKYLLSGFLLALCLGMVVYLIPGFMSDTTVTRTGIVATVAGEDIHAQDVNKMVQAQLRAQHYPPQFAVFLAQRAAQTLIQGAEVRYEAGRMGLKVSDEEVRDELRNGPYKQYFFPNGVWIGQKKYEELLQNNETSVAEFENNMRDDLLARKLMSTITAGVTVSPAEIEQAYKNQNTKVKFQYAVLDSADLEKQVKPTDAELKAYYEANKARYQSSVPEKREIRYFVLNDRDAAAKVIVNPADFQQYYSAHQDEYRVPDRARVRHILIKTPTPGPDGKVDQKAVDEARAKAEDVLKQIKAGGDFAELAKKYSQDPGSAQNGGELGWIVKGQTVPEFEKTAFEQNPGQMSGLVQTSYGFHIIQTEEKEPAHMKPLSEVKAAIEQAVKAQKTSAVLNQQANQAEAVAQKQGIDKAATQFGAQVVQSNPVARNEALPGVGQAAELMNEIFATQANAAPQLGRSTQSYVVYQVTKIDPPRAPAFEEIRDRVATDFKTERVNGLLRKQTQELADRAHSLHDLAKAAKETGATVKTSDLVGKTDQVPDIGPLAGPASAAFNMKPGEISGPLNLGKKGLVLTLLDRQEPSTADAQYAQARDQLMEQLSNQKRQQVLQLFLDNLNTRMEKDGKVKINKSEMDNLTKARG